MTAVPRGRFFSLPPEAVATVFELADERLGGERPRALHDAPSDPEQSELVAESLGENILA